MSTIKRLSAAQPFVRAEHFNQYGYAFNGVFGVNERDQQTLGRLVLPKSSAAPGSPTQGQVYFDTDDEEPRVHDGTRWLPFANIRQIKSTRATQRTNMDRGAWNRMLELEITPSGGAVLVFSDFLWQFYSEFDTVAGMIAHIGSALWYFERTPGVDESSIARIGTNFSLNSTFHPAGSFDTAWAGHNKNVDVFLTPTPGVPLVVELWSYFWQPFYNSSVRMANYNEDTIGVEVGDNPILTNLGATRMIAMEL